MKIIDYALVTRSTSPAENGRPAFETLVKEKIDEGYVPIGGVCLSQSSGSFTRFVQAMVKYEE